MTRHSAPTREKSRLTLPSLIRATAIAVVTLLSSVPIGSQPNQVGPSDDEKTYAAMALFGTVLDQIRRNHVDLPDDRELVRAAIGGMLRSLDPHSNYLPPDIYDAMSVITSGAYGGVGLRTHVQDGAIIIVEALENSPASRAGLQAGDEIRAVDGVPTHTETHDEAVNRLRGSIGSRVMVEIVRPATDTSFTVNLVRDLIAIPAVSFFMDGDIATIRISNFSAQAERELHRAIERVHAQRQGAAPKGIILDLRNNPGGLVDQAVYIADTFLPRGAVVLLRGRGVEQGARHDAAPDDMDARLAGVPLVVLINGASASSSEIVAGALQDHRRAIVIGTRSFGKGSVQSVIALGANGAMRLTTARYFTPANRSIQALGIIPDIVIDQVVPPELAGSDIVPGEAALEGHMTMPGQAEAIGGSSAYIPGDRADDTQLQYALRLLNGLEQHPAFVDMQGHGQLSRPSSIPPETPALPDR